MIRVLFVLRFACNWLDLSHQLRRKPLLLGTARLPALPNAGPNRAGLPCSMKK